MDVSGQVHVFKCLDTYLALDVESGSLHGIDELMAELLALYPKKSKPEIWAILRERNEEISRQAFIAEMKNRTNQEVQYLVHDLKSPLTAIQTIVDVLKIERERNHLPEMEYLERIEHSVERMDQMISEMLHEGSMVPISTETIVNIVLAQCSATEYASYLCVENSVPQKPSSQTEYCFHARSSIF